VIDAPRHCRSSGNQAGAFATRRAAAARSTLLAHMAKVSRHQIRSAVMLSRAADRLFRMARSMERAENTVHMLDINLKVPQLPQTPEQEARAMFGAAHLQMRNRVRAAQRRTDPRTRALDPMVADANNPSSVDSYWQAARKNARAARGTPAIEQWETINDRWLEFNERISSDQAVNNPRALFEWVKCRSHLSHSVAISAPRCRTTCSSSFSLALIWSDVLSL
jgi:hypothetical protein